MNARFVLFVWMAAAVASTSLLAAEPTRDSAVASKAEAPSRSLMSIQRDVQAALRAEASSRRVGPNVPEVMRLVELYREMASHPQRDTSDFLADLGLSVRGRLKDIREQIERKTAKAARQKSPLPTLPKKAAPETQVLAQQLGGPGGAPAGGGANGTGGRPAAGQGFPPFDYGPELVDIIETTISPATWDINGGPGAVVYFAHSQALVVSAPDEVHPQIANLLGQLRAAQ